jgi:hypothetical protein
MVDAQSTKVLCAQSDADEEKSTIETKGPATVLASETLVSGEVVFKEAPHCQQQICAIHLATTTTYDNRVISAQHAGGNGRLFVRKLNRLHRESRVISGVVRSVRRAIEGVGDLCAGVGVGGGAREGWERLQRKRWI